MLQKHFSVQKKNNNNNSTALIRAPHSFEALAEVNVYLRWISESDESVEFGGFA